MNISDRKLRQKSAHCEWRWNAGSAQRREMPSWELWSASKEDGYLIDYLTHDPLTNEWISETGERAADFRRAIVAVERRANLHLDPAFALASLLNLFEDVRLDASEEEITGALALAREALGLTDETEDEGGASDGTR